MSIEFPNAATVLLCVAFTVILRCVSTLHVGCKLAAISMAAAKFAQHGCQSGVTFPYSPTSNPTSSTATSTTS